MKIIFYQANFCAECGNAMKPRFSWWPRYFCEECEAQMKLRSGIKPLAVLLLCASLAVFALNRTQPSGTATQSSAISSTPALSATDLIQPRNSVSKSEMAERVLCGARTKKGTPCKRLAHPGQRCAQHRGMPSLLESNAGKAATAGKEDASR
jgi:hypothetical protein